MVWKVFTKIEIAAPPEVVREKFLNFSEIRTYSPHGYVNAITPVTPDSQLAVGDKLLIDITMGKFEAPIVVNTPEEFAWLGGIPYIFSGIHTFRFLPSETGTPGHTTLIQEEDFWGALGWLMGKSWPAGWIGLEEQTRKNYEGLNEDLKRALESK